MALLTNKQALGVVALAAVGVWYVRRKLPEVAQAVNPVNRENVFYQGTNAVGGALTGERDFSFGAWLWEVTNPAEREQEIKMLTGRS